MRVLTQKYKFESNSQHLLYSNKFFAIASSHTKIQIWKQFTTNLTLLNGYNWLRVLTQKYKFESNSQLDSILLWEFINCEFSHKNTNLKAIHNKCSIGYFNPSIASSHTKIQIWKQFTTIIQHYNIYTVLRVLTQKYKFESNSQHTI